MTHLCKCNDVADLTRIINILLKKKLIPHIRPFKVIQTDTNWPANYDFLLVFSSNFVPRTHRFRDIWLKKCCDLENRVRGPSMWLEMSPFDTVHTTSDWRSIVTVALSRVVSEIFNVEKCRDLKSGSEVTQGHQKWYHSIHYVSFLIGSIVTLSVRCTVRKSGTVVVR